MIHFFSGVHQHNETALCRTFTTWFTSKQRRDPRTVDRETTGEALGVTVEVSRLAICPLLVVESSLLQDA
jgi:hypothetical protein